MSTTRSNVAIGGTLTVTGATSIGAATATSTTIGATGTALTLVKKGTIAVTLAATAAAAEEDVSLTITGAAVGDIVIMTPLDAAMETGVAIVAAWVSATNTVKVRVSNLHTSSLTGSTANWQYCLIRS
jgi:hypothetical protein